ncbi:MAG: glycoside hydrolase family 127 protein [Treponema sp.]|nr:glycoside hydrolase family 127 protein [Candidatus Treponema caballi]
MNSIQITDTFFSKYRELVRKEMIPYQWKVLNDEIAVNIERERNDDTIPNEKSHCIENFRIAAGRSQGHHYGWVFQDSDVYKWLEAVSYSLKEKPDAALQKLADSVVDLIADAQEDDGYLSTYFTIEAPQRKFRDLAESHELYCAGHFMEAAVAYHEATGNETVLATARKLADCIYRWFSPEEMAHPGADGHEEVEIGLMKLYHATGEKRYLKLAKHFLEERGKNPDFFREQRSSEENYIALLNGVDHFPLSYFQWHKDIYAQDTAEGHAVRLMYMCTAMADVAEATGNSRMYEACRKIWRNIVDKRMYITGGIGSTVTGESFTFDYDLPDDTMYCETCASVALMFFARNMLKNETRGEYGDIMERALYNTVLDGMALDGRHFFYVNPLQVLPEASAKDPGKSHVKPVRPEWLGCACCPPNLARLLASLEKYAFHEYKGAVFADLFMSSSAQFGTLSVVEKTRYPWEEAVTFTLDSSDTAEHAFAVRIPSWTSWGKGVTLTVNGAHCDLPAPGQIICCPSAAGDVLCFSVSEGYLYIRGQFRQDTLELTFDMPVVKMAANPAVRSENGKVAVMRGPVVYTLESADNGEGLYRLFLRDDTDFSYEFKKDMLNGVGVITGKGYRIAGAVCGESTPADTPLYAPYTDETEERAEQVRLIWIPYYAWANRGKGEMAVWIRQK